MREDYDMPPQPDPIRSVEQTLVEAVRDLPAHTSRRLIADVAAVATYAQQGGDLAEVQTVLERDGADAARAFVAAGTA